MFASVPTKQSPWGSHQGGPNHSRTLSRHQNCLGSQWQKRWLKGTINSCPAQRQTFHPGTHDLDPLGSDRARSCWTLGTNIGTMGLIYFSKLKMHCAFGKKFINIMLPWSKNNMYQCIFCPSLGNGFPNPALHKCVSEHSFTCT